MLPRGNAYSSECYRVFFKHSASLDALYGFPRRTMGTRETDIATIYLVPMLRVGMHTAANVNADLKHSASLDALYGFPRRRHSYNISRSHAPAWECIQQLMLPRIFQAFSQPGRIVWVPMEDHGNQRTRHSYNISRSHALRGNADNGQRYRVSQAFS